MKISYVLPVWNAEHVLNVTIRSLLNQTHKDNEIIIINDGSTDRSQEIIDFYKNQNSNIKTFVYKDRNGAAYCRNLGNSNATGDIIAVCDCDSYMKNRGEIIEKFFSDTDFDVFYSSIKCIDADDPSREWIQEAFKWDFNSKCPISHPTVAYKRDLMSKFRYHERSKDTDLFEFLLLDMHNNDVKFGGAQDVTCVKYEGDSERDKTISSILKKEMYKIYGITI